ncbi:MAG: sulfotransferase [Chitinophagales bacterium]
MFKGNQIDRKYYPKIIFFVIISALVEPFRWIERKLRKRQIENFKIEEDPVFIIGHWRSGTTFLHNILCKDPQMGFVTTFQAIYPETIFSGSKLVKGMMKVMMPKNRAADNMELGTDLPQEEEFALSNTHAMSYYNFWFFPKRWKEYFKHYIEFQDVSPEIVKRWKSEYVKLVKKALINTKGKRFISKNPPNTGRIDVLLELFPNAKFIHIYRHPVNTFVSTKKFVEETIGPLQLHDISSKELEDNILWTYDKLMKRFESQRDLIPAENLYEIKFEEFENNALATIEEVYQKLNLSGFDTAKPIFEKYLEEQESYQKNDHVFPEETVKKVTQNWGFAMRQWDYVTPGKPIQQMEAQLN